MPYARHSMISGALRVVGQVAALFILVLFAPACSAGGRDFRAVPPAGNGGPPDALPAPSAWLDYLNFYRATARISPVTENTAWSDGDRKHAIYIVRNDALRHSEDPATVGYTPEGQKAAQQSNLFYSCDRDTSDWRAIDTWMQSPFHALGVLDPRLVQVGYGSYKETGGNLRMGAALNVVAGTRHSRAATYPVFWPGNDTVIPINSHREGSPSPLTSCPGYTAPSGLPLILQIGPGDLTPVVSATSFSQNGQPLEHCVFSESTYRNPDRDQQKLGRSILGARGAIVLVPRAPLATGTTYTASITVDGRTHTWSFSTGGAAQARDVAGTLHERQRF